MNETVSIEEVPVIMNEIERLINLLPENIEDAERVEAIDRKFISKTRYSKIGEMKVAIKAAFKDILKPCTIEDLVKRCHDEHRCVLLKQLLSWSERREEAPPIAAVGKNLKQLAMKLMDISESDYDFLRDFSKQSYGKGELLINILFGRYSKKHEHGDVVIKDEFTGEERFVEVKYLGRLGNGVGFGRSYEKLPWERDGKSYYPYEMLKDFTPDDEGYGDYEEDMMKLLLSMHDLVFLVGDELVVFTEKNLDDMIKAGYSYRFQHGSGYNMKIFLRQEHR